MGSPEVFTLGSLFSGIGGLELGLEMTGRFKTVWQVEQSEYCRKVLRRHWPDALQFEDVRNVGKENLPAVDVICGGFPCQDISNAGRRAGIIEGNRSGLWYEYVRILREIRPRFVVVENVSALLARGLDVVLGELSALGYDAEWEAIPAAAVGAPHIRDRLWLLAYSRREFGAWRNPHRGRRNDSSPKRDGWGQAFGGEDRELVTLVPGVHPRTPADWWQSQSRMDRSANGIPDWSHRVKALGNAVVPQCARVIGEWLLEIDAELSQEGAA